MAQQQVTGLDPRVAFSMDAIVGTGFSPRDAVTEAYHEVTGVAPAKAPEGEPHSLFPAAGIGAVIYFLQQLQPWLSTAADLAQLGTLGLLILQKLREKLGSERRAAVFSKEMVEGMCLRTLEERAGTEIREVSFSSHAFDRYSGEPVAREYRMNGTAIYLIWIRAGSDRTTHLFLVDAWGKAWGEWDTRGVSQSEGPGSRTT